MEEAFTRYVGDWAVQVMETQWAGVGAREFWLARACGPAEFGKSGDVVTKLNVLGSSLFSQTGIGNCMGGLLCRYWVMLESHQG